VIGHGDALQTTSNDASRDILIDTSQAATDTIDYVPTDTWGNTATSSRTARRMPVNKPFLRAVFEQSRRYLSINS
jgi:hypothetical protein